MRRFLPVLLFLLAIQDLNSVVNAQTSSNPQVCATPGNDGPTNITGSINTYFPALPNTTLTAGTNNIALAAVPVTDAYGNSFGTTAINAGDLLLIVQMQDATISFSNDVFYGANNATAGADGLGATGFTDIGNSGRYEYVVATNNVPLTGGTLTFAGSGTGNGTVYSYTNADPTATRGKRTFQIIRIPQYSNLRLSSNISPPPFNGTAGGIIAFSVAGNMNFNGYTIDVSGRGFRGGYSLIKVTQGVNLNDLYVAISTDDRVSGKGEGIAGTPRYMWDGYNQVDNIIEGLPGGSGGRGAPANAAGGGNDVNAGGGGGGNGGDGGVGGYGYQVDPGTFPNGGRPGTVDYVGAVDATRLIMGGGGGGGHANDALTGVKGGVGGGIVLISAGSISGTGTILANGGDGAPGTYGGHPDGSGGGGAGGTVLVKVSNPDPTALLTINTIGGNGGNTQFDDPATTGVQPHGPGGGGGGGLIYYAVSSGTVNANVAGGPSGKTNSGAGITHNAADGNPGVLTKFTIASLPPFLQGSGGACYPELVTTMTALPIGVIHYPGDTVTYTVKITNNSTGGSAGGVEANCSFPSAISFVAASATYTGTANGPSAITNSGSANQPTFGDFNIPFGDTVIITLTAKIDCSASGTYNGNAQAVYLDPTRTYTQPTRRITAATNAFTGSNTTYQTGIIGPIPGSNYSGVKSSTGDITVAKGSPNTITAPTVASFCTSGTPATINGTTPAGGNGTYTYQWQSSADSLNFTNITGAIAASYTPPTLTSSAYYRRVVTGGACATLSYSNIISIKVSTPPATPVVTTPTEYICAGSSATFKIANPQAGIIYNWYSSSAKTSVLFSGPTYVTGPVTGNATYYVDAESGGCASASVATAQVIDEPLPTAPQLGTNAASLCYGDYVIFTDSTPENGYFNWYLVPTGSTPIATGDTYTTPPLTADITYYLESENQNGCLSATRTKVAITIIPLPSPPPAQSPVSVCAGSSATLNVTSPQQGFTYNWYATATGGTSVHTGTSFTTPVITAATTYYIEAVNANGCPSATRTPVQVTPSTPPATPVPVSATVSVCTGNSATLSVASPQAALTYNWYDSPTQTNLLFTGTSYTTVNLYNNATYYVEALNGTCTSPAMASVQVNVTQPPATPVLSNSTTQICAGSTATLSIANPQVGITYNWYTTATGGTSIATGTSFTTTAALTANTSYFAEADNSNSCASATRAEADITVNPLPDGPGTTALNTCAGSTTTVYVNDPLPGVTYNWYTSATGGTPVFTGITYTTPPITGPTTYYAEAVNASGCTSFRTPAPIAVTQAPLTPTPTNATLAICTGSTATLLVANPQAGITYNWYDSAAKVNLLGSGSTYTTVPLNANTTFYVDAENGTCPSSSLASVQVTVGSAPAVPVLTNNALQVCAGSATTLSVANPQAGLTYNWYTTATGGTSQATGTSFTTGNLSANTSYFVEAANNGGCTSLSRAEATITVESTPGSPGMGANTVCMGSAATINISPVVPGLMYNWYTVPTGGTSVFTGTTYVTPALTGPTTFYAEAVNSAGCSSSRAALPLIVTSPPATPTLTNATQSVCTGSTATLSVANPQAGITYNWYDSATKTNFLANGPTYTTVAINANTTFYVEAENGTCPSPALASAQVNVVAAPVEPGVTNSIAQACYGSQFTSTITNAQAGYSYNWYMVASGGTPVFTGTTFTTPALTASTIYYAEAVNSTGCASAIRSPVSINVLPDPSTPIIAAVGAGICPGTNATLSATADAGTTIQWFATATGGTAMATGSSYTTPDLNTTTTYYAQAINSNNCESARAAATVTVLQQLAAPVVTVSATTNTSITFEWAAVDGATGYQVSTDGGATFTAPSSGSDGLSHTVTGLVVNQSVTIIVQATGDLGCELSVSSTAVTGVATYPPNDIIYVANTFTPNGDAKNDVVYVHGNSIKSMNFFVYDQWGELLFKSSDLSVGWNGTYKGKREPVGVYVYYVQAVMSDGQKLTKKGTITLLR